MSLHDSPYRIHYKLCMPNLGNEGGDSSFLLLKLVDSVTSNPRAKRQQVHGIVMVRSIHTGWDIINDTRLESDITVVQQKRRKSRVDNGGNSSEQRSSHQWNHTNGNTTLKSPMQRTMQFVWLGMNVCFIDSSNDEPWRLGNGLYATHQGRLDQ